MSTRLKAQQVAVHILENILKRRRYGARVLDDITGAIERSWLLADHAAETADASAQSDTQAELLKVRRENTRLKDEVDYYMRLAEDGLARIAAIRKILNQEQETE